MLFGQTSRPGEQASGAEHTMECTAVVLWEIRRALLTSITPGNLILKKEREKEKKGNFELLRPATAPCTAFAPAGMAFPVSGPWIPPTPQAHAPAALPVEPHSPCTASPSPSAPPLPPAALFPPGPVSCRYPKLSPYLVCSYCVWSVVQPGTQPREEGASDQLPARSPELSTFPGSSDILKRVR